MLIGKLPSSEAVSSTKVVKAVNAITATPVSATDLARVASQSSASIDTATGHNAATHYQSANFEAANLESSKRESSTLASPKHATTPPMGGDSSHQAHFSTDLTNASSSISLRSGAKTLDAFINSRANAGLNSRAHVFAAASSTLSTAKLSVDESPLVAGQSDKGTIDKGTIDKVSQDTQALAPHVSVVHHADNPESAQAHSAIATNHAIAATDPFNGSSNTSNTAATDEYSGLDRSHEESPTNDNAAEPEDKHTNHDEHESDEHNPSRALAELAQAELIQLQQRDSEVRQHEQAHAALGGMHAGAPSYQFEQGSDGKRYAVEGEVAIDVSVITGDPQATIKKMQQIHAAALAPMEPSMADIQVANLAMRNMQQARQQLADEREQASRAKFEEAFSDNTAFGKAERSNSIAEKAKTQTQDHDSQLAPQERYSLTPPSATLAIKGSATANSDDSTSVLIEQQRRTNSELVALRLTKRAG
ncbi:hypothetical protein FJQ87_10150 [Shewanella sp. SNU WT4]|uniref:putative metalloprotease CJM1_0395 family protein n=1 Tax=Shewanella sp. SNU WT4 TaxID=2590015 RepID=UPI00112630BA|nr:putative metalloprotease CJM1_0395 family protein [Shewanella sp. SNU WT4]QDF67022.1 hypothetical protein FJQ87_10150 [Shewanella sp. SNU WT4]